MSELKDETVTYYDRRAGEYDATSWDVEVEQAVAAEASRMLRSLPEARTLDIGCGTGFVSRWLPGEITLLDSSLAMLEIALRRLPKAEAVQAVVPPLPFPDRSFGRAFTANLYGHFLPAVRSDLLAEMKRVADEVIVLDELSRSDAFSEGPEQRELTDGSSFTIHKCYFTIERLLEELGGGDVLMSGPVLGIVRHRVREQQ